MGVFLATAYAQKTSREKKRIREKNWPKVAIKKVGKGGVGNIKKHPSLAPFACVILRREGKMMNLFTLFKGREGGMALNKHLNPPLAHFLHKQFII